MSDSSEGCGPLTNASPPGTGRTVDARLDAGLYSWASRELHRFIASRLVRSGKGSAEARELLSVVFERFWKSRSHAIRKPVPYLIRIAENVLNEFLLRQSRSIVTYDSQVANDAAQSLPDGSGADPMLERLASQQQLKRILAQIPPMYRAVLILRTRDELSPEEIGRKLGISPGTARIYFQRAIAACRAADWER